MAKRRCTVSVEIDGKRYSIDIKAESIYHAAMLFSSHCAAPPPGTFPPKVNQDTVVDVSPCFRVRIGDAFAAESAKANRKAKK
jgi:hypothetical protein